VITAVTGFGLFVELTDIYVEGLVHVTALPGDYYHFDPVHHRLAGERTGRSFRLGDTVEVRVMRVDLDERKIDFEMSEKTTSAPIGRKRKAADPAPAGKEKEKEKEKEKASAARPSRRSASKEPVVEAYRPSDAAAKNAEVRKSREMKKALLAEAKGGSKATSGTSSRSDAAPESKSGKTSKHRKGPSKSGSAPAAKSGGVRKPKAKS
jgi:ribonuclease R